MLYFRKVWLAGAELLSGIKMLPVEPLNATHRTDVRIRMG